MAAAAGSTVQGAGTLAQQLLRKRYVGITGSNKVVGALEVQQVSLYLPVTYSVCASVCPFSFEELSECLSIFAESVILP